jgi:hypothetical protein
MVSEEIIKKSFYHFQDLKGPKRPTSIILRFYFKSDFKGFFSFDSLWNFLPAFVNKSWPNYHCFRDKSSQRDQEAPTPKMITYRNSKILLLVLSYHRDSKLGLLDLSYHCNSKIGVLVLSYHWNSKIGLLVLSYHWNSKIGLLVLSYHRNCKGCNKSENDNFLNLSLICVMLFHWIPLKNTCLINGNRFIACWSFHITATVKYYCWFFHITATVN